MADLWRPTEEEARQVLAKLSPTMCIGLCRQPCPSWWGSAPAAMPHSEQTVRALHSRKLIIRPVAWRHRAYPLTPLGSAVRDLLKGISNA